MKIRDLCMSVHKRKWMHLSACIAVTSQTLTCEYVAAGALYGHSCLHTNGHYDIIFTFQADCGGAYLLLRQAERTQQQRGEN